MLTRPRWCSRVARASQTHRGRCEGRSRAVTPVISLIIYLRTSLTESGSRHSSTSSHTSLVCSEPAREKQKGESLQRLPNPWRRA